MKNPAEEMLEAFKTNIEGMVKYIALQYNPAMTEEFLKLLDDAKLKAQLNRYAPPSCEWPREEPDR